MNISKGLQQQIDRLINVGAFVLNHQQKEELRNLVNDAGLPEYTNLSCGSCTRTAMHNLNAFLKQKESKPVLSVKMVKKPTEMSYKELRKACKSKGIKTGKNPTKQQLIKLLS